MRTGREPWYVVAGGFIAAWVLLDLLTRVLHPSPGVSPWYPGAGLTLVLLYRFGLRYAPALVVAEALRWSLGHTAIPLLAVCLVGAVIAGVYAVAIALLRDVAGVVLPSRRVRDVFWFCGTAVAASGVAAAGAVAVLVAFHEFPPSAFVAIAQNFWLGDAVGILAIAPLADLALSSARGQLPAAYQRHVPVVAELAAVAAVAALAFFAFGALLLDPARLVAFALTFIPVAIIATRDGLRGAVLGAATLDLTLIGTDALLRPSHAIIVAGQLDAIVQTVLAFVLGALSTSKYRYRNYSRWLVTHDPRTALPSREAFDAWLGGDGVGEFWVACVDIDHFSFFDASMERAGADALLRAATERIAGAVPAANFFGRFESAAFVIARTGTRDDAVTFTNRIVEAFRAPFTEGEGELRFTLSIGVASGAGRERRTLLTEAIAAMREATIAGGNTVTIFEPPPGLPRGTRMASELVRARDQQEFVLHYQPIYDLRSHRIVGFEALLRWQHPELGLLRPGTFLPALERSRLLDDIEPWVVREAAAALSRMPRTAELRVWVNVSGSAAFDDAFVDELPHIAQAAGVAPGRLVIEVTEQLVAGSERMAEVTARMRALGIGVAVDDFGTGYSTFDRVRASHIDYLKLDRSFVSAVVSDDRARGVAFTMLTLANEIGANALAEGLETQEQINVFRDGGCKLGQGYGLDEPMTEAALFRRLSA